MQSTIYVGWRAEITMNKINNLGILKGIITGMAEYIDTGLLGNVGKVEHY